MPFVKRGFFLLLSILATENIQGQRQASIWYFGTRAGLSFQTEYLHPKVLTDGALSTDEGCSAICDEHGNLLFYTDGVTVFNRNHVTMKNGTGLRGYYRSTQSALIVPWPGQLKYFIFTVDDGGSVPVNGNDSTGLRYSLVDMTLEAGLGAVVQKNVGLYSPTTEKLTAAQHANGRDFWVVSHEWDSDFFFLPRHTRWPESITCQIKSRHRSR